jgi:hypothetical protein
LAIKGDQEACFFVHCKHSHFQAKNIYHANTAKFPFNQPSSNMALGSESQQAKGEATQKQAEAERGTKDFKTNVQETVSLDTYGTYFAFSLL